MFTVNVNILLAVLIIQYSGVTKVFVILMQRYMHELIYLMHANIYPHKLPAMDQKMNQMSQVKGSETSQPKDNRKKRYYN